MKKFLTLFAILATLTASAQSRRDTVCVDIPVYQGVLAAAQQRDVLLERVDILNEKISLLERDIRSLEKTDSLTVASYNKEIAIMKEQRELLEKTIRKLKRQLFWTKVGAGLGMAAVGYLYITK